MLHLEAQREAEGLKGRVLGTLGLATACAKAGSLEGVTQVIDSGWSLRREGQLHGS